MATAQRETGLKFRWWQALRDNPPRWPIWKESKGVMFAVAMALHGHADRDGSSIFPASSTVAAIAGLTRNTVDKYRAALIDLNMMAEVRRRKGEGVKSSIELRLVEPSEWRDLDDEFARAMAGVPSVPMASPSPVAPGVDNDRDKVRALIDAAPNLDAVYQIREQWPLGELGLINHARDRALAFQLKGSR